MTTRALGQLLEDATAITSDQLRVAAGIDRVELEMFTKLLASSGDGFLHEVYAPGEISYSAGRVERLAARFCAKEAALKALGTGMRGVSLREIEVIHNPNGQPDLVLLGRAKSQAAALHIVSIAVSMTHTALAAEAFVVALMDVRNDSRLEEENY